VVTREAPSSDCHLLFPGHVFPEFKESDAMFAAERVSPGSASTDWLSSFGEEGEGRTWGSFLFGVW
jgi:hypothetical protein